MKIILSLLVLFLLAAIIFFCYRKFRSFRLKRQQRRYEIVVTEALQDSLGKVSVAGFNGKKVALDQIAVTQVAKAWGLNVVVFGYSFPAQALDKKQVRQVKEALSEQLKIFAQQHSLNSPEEPSSLVISDIWQRDLVLNVEVAYLINEQTKGYLRDVEKLDH